MATEAGRGPARMSHVGIRQELERLHLLSAPPPSSEGCGVPAGAQKEVHVAGKTCDFCWKRPAPDPDGSPYVDLCKGCRYEVDRVANYLDAHGFRILRTDASEVLDPDSGEIIDLRERSHSRHLGYGSASEVNSGAVESKPDSPPNPPDKGSRGDGRVKTAG